MVELLSHNNMNMELTCICMLNYIIGMTNFCKLVSPSKREVFLLNVSSSTNRHHDFHRGRCVSGPSYSPDDSSDYISGRSRRTSRRTALRLCSGNPSGRRCMDWRPRVSRQASGEKIFQGGL